VSYANMKRAELLANLKYRVILAASGLYSLEDSSRLFVSARKMVSQALATKNEMVFVSLNTSMATSSSRPNQNLLLSTHERKSFKNQQE